MDKKILVCLDGSKLAEAIIPYAVEQARRLNNQLLLFRAYSEPAIISPAMPGMPGFPIESPRGGRDLIEDEQEAETYLKILADKLRKKSKISVSYSKVLGPPGSTIVEYGNKRNIELIAITTHGRSGLGRVVLGSVAEYVIRNSSKPVLLIGPTKG